MVDIVEKNHIFKQLEYIHDYMSSENTRSKRETGREAGENGLTVRTDGGLKYCVGCGNEIKIDRSECQHCGTLQDGEQPDEADNENPTTSTTTDPPEPNQTAGSKEIEPSAGSTNNIETDPSSTDDGPDPTGATPGVGEEYCSNCGEILSKDVDYCPHCRTDRQSSNAQSGREKSPALAAVLTLILIGSGHIYNGQVLRGIGFFFAAMFAAMFAGITLGLAIPVVLAVWAYAVYDAYTNAKRINLQ